MDFWNKEESVHSLSLEEEEAKKEAKKMYKKWVMSWRQKSKEIWLKEEDRNTRFFHQMASAHRKRNQLTRVKVNGRWLTKKSEIKAKVSKAFQGLLVDPGDWKPGIDGLNFERLEELDVEGLEKPFSEEEVFGALSDFCEEKVPGLDGFSMAL